MIKGIIFDMDGVILDSNHIHYENWNGFFRRNFFITLDKKDFGMQLGKSAKHFGEYFIEKYNVAKTFEEVFPEIREGYSKLNSKIILKEGVVETLNRLKRKYKLALATGANKDFAVEMLTHLKVISYFSFIIGGDEVTAAKPEPEIFLKAAEGLHLAPDECVVVEDAVLGIMAAKKAGMKAISIPDEFTKYQYHKIADAKLRSIKDVNSDLLKKLGLPPVVVVKKKKPSHVFN
jgi:HAD superfamily hydrolase (TIGR01509 family)